MLRRAFLAVVLLVLVIFAGRGLLRSLASDEKKIRWRLEEMAAGFSEADLGDVMKGLAPGFRDESSGAERREVQDVLLSLYFNERDAKTKRFLLRARIDLDGTTIEVREGTPRTALIHLHALVERLKGEGVEPWWNLHATAEMVRNQGAWQIERTREVNHRERDQSGH